MPIELVTPKKKRPLRPPLDVINVVTLLDKYGSYPSHGLTPLRLSEICKEADQGDVYRQMELFEEMQEKDAHLGALFQSRRQAVLKWQYEIIPGADTPEDKKIAEFVRKVVERCKTWRRFQEDLLDAVAKGYSVQQILWNIDAGGQVGIEGFEWVHQKNFRFGRASDLKSNLNEIRRLTDENRTNGVDLEPYKWIVALIKSRSGYPSRTSISRSCAWPYLFKNGGTKSLMIFCEIFGIPLRIGKYDETSPTREKDIEVLTDAIRGLARDAGAVIGKNTEIEFPEPAQKGTTVNIYDSVLNRMDDWQSKAVLGHTGTIQSTPGKLGNENAAQEIRLDLVEADALAMDGIITDQFILPLVMFNFGEQEVYPYFKTKIEKPKDLQLSVTVDEALVRMGFPLSQQYASEFYGRPIAKEGEPTLQPAQQTVPFQSAAFKGLLGTKAELLK